MFTYDKLSVSLASLVTLASDTKQVILENVAKIAAENASASPKMRPKGANAAKKRILNAGTGDSRPRLHQVYNKEKFPRKLSSG